MSVNETKKRLYHMSQTLQLGDSLQPDFLQKKERYQPYIQALRNGGNSINDLIEYQRKDPSVDWNELVKCLVEGVFEYIRETEFPMIPSRLNSSYYFEGLEHFETLYQAGWAQEPPEKQALVHLFEIEIEEEQLHRFDMCVFDEAYDVMLERQDLQFVIDSARKYFSGEHTAEPIWEVMSDKPAKAVKDITDCLHNGQPNNVK